MKAAIGNRMPSDSEDPEDLINTLLGPHRNPRCNESGELIRSMMHELDLRAVSTFFDTNGSHNIWIHLVSKDQYQPDHILIPCNQLSKVVKVKRKFNGSPRDHAAVMMIYKFNHPSHIPQKTKNKATQKVKKIDVKLEMCHFKKKSLTFLKN